MAGITHILCDEVSVEPADEPYPVQIDGEIFHDLPLNCKIVKGGIKTFQIMKNEK